MRHSYEVAAELAAQEGAKSPDRSLQPKIRRQVERICESLGLEFDDLKEMHIYPGRVQTASYARNEAGAIYLDQTGQVALTRGAYVADTVTRLGDEGDT